MNIDKALCSYHVCSSCQCNHISHSPPRSFLLAGQNWDARAGHMHSDQRRRLETSKAGVPPMPEPEALCALCACQADSLPQLGLNSSTSRAPLARRSGDVGAPLRRLFNERRYGAARTSERMPLGRRRAPLPPESRSGVAPAPLPPEMQGAVGSLTMRVLTRLLNAARRPSHVLARAPVACACARAQARARPRAGRRAAPRTRAKLARTVGSHGQTPERRRRGGRPLEGRTRGRAGIWAQPMVYAPSAEPEPRPASTADGRSTRTR